MNNTNEINGIDIKRLKEMKNAVEIKPFLSRFCFKVNNTWMSGGHSRSLIKGFYGAGREDNTRTFPFIIEIDQPSTLLGKNNGPTPLEYVLNALAGCFANSIVYNAALKGIIIHEIESELKGNFDIQRLFSLQNRKEVPFDSIKMQIRIKGENLTIDKKIFLCEIGKKSSMVFKIITNPFPVSISVE